MMHIWPIHISIVDMNRSSIQSLTLIRLAITWSQSRWLTTLVCLVWICYSVFLSY